MINFARRMETFQPSAIREMARLMADPAVISFAGGNPAPETFPIEVLGEIARKVISKKGATILQYGSTEGFPSLREAVLEHMIRPKGIEASNENMVILGGSVQGFDLISKVLINPGDNVLVEAPTFSAALQAFRLQGANCIGMEMDDYGIRMDDVEQKMLDYKPKFLYCIPTFQNPSGKTLPLDRRKTLAELAAKYNVIILEDDPYCDLRFKGEAVPNIKCFDLAEKVVLLSSFSKIMAPAIRIGVAVADPKLAKAMTNCRQCADGMPSGITLAIADEFLHQGHLEAQLKLLPGIYEKRCAIMMEAIARYFPKGIKVTVPEGGMFTWLEAPEKDIDFSQVLRSSLEQEKVAYIPGASFFCIPGKGKNAFRLNYSTPPIEQIAPGVEKLGRVLHQFL